MRVNGMVFSPAIHVILTVQFADPLPNYNALSMAALYQLYEDEFPEFEQVPVAGPMPYTATQVLGIEAVTPVVSDAPRVQFTSRDGNWVIFVQYDRMSFSWQRVDPSDPSQVYPGFEEFYSRFIAYFLKLTKFYERDSIVVVPNVAELAYVNAFKMVEEDGTFRRLSTIYTLLSPVEPTVKMFGFNYQWNEPIQEANGVLQTTLQGISFFGENVPHSVASFSGVMKVDGASMDGLERSIREMRSAVRGVYDRVVFPQRAATY